MNEAGGVVQNIINRALSRASAYAPASRQRLERLSPQVWRVRMDDLDITVDLEADGDTLIIAPPRRPRSRGEYIGVGTGVHRIDPKH